MVLLRVISITYLLSMAAFGQYYDTLPEGRRFFLYKNVKSEVKSGYNQSMAEIPYSYEIDANIEELLKIENESVQAILETFREYPDAFNNISLGTHQIKANAEINVDVYAAGYGITDTVTAYVGIPIYEAKVTVDYERKKNSTEQEVADTLKEQYGDNWAQTLGHLVDQVYSFDEGTIQSGITNAYGYEELGDWQGEGLGDIELGIMYNFYKQDTHGLKLTLGTVAPTGYTDDPDILQDVGFGDGQWDAFVEFGGGYIVNDDVNLNAWTRYTYQFAHERDLRVPMNEDIKESGEKKTFNEKKGNKQLFGIDSNIFITDWFKFNPAFIYEHVDATQYSSDDSEVDKILESGTERSSQNVRLTAQFTTVRLFQQGKFLAPGQINFTVQNMVQGQNTPKADLVEFEFRMYF